MDNEFDYIKMISDFGDSIKNGLETVKVFSESFECGVKKVYNFFEYLESINYQDLLNNFEEGLKINVESINKYLLKENWYLPNISLENMIDLLNIINDESLEDKEKYKAVDFIMQEIVSKSKDNLKSKLNFKFEERQSIFEEMFKAYEEERYILCIPVMLAQIDGICNKILGVNFFSKEYEMKNTPKTKRAIERKISEKSLNKLEISELIPLYFVSKFFKKINNENILNRHNILHGTSYMYGNKLNADKCIALIGFLLKVDNIINGELYAEESM